MYTENDLYAMHFGCVLPKTYDLLTEYHPKLNRTNCRALAEISISVRALETPACAAKIQPLANTWPTINLFAVEPAIVSTLYATNLQLPKQYSTNGNKIHFIQRTKMQQP